jgi:hypothetical protein
MKKHQNRSRPLFLSSHHGELAHFSVTIKPGARGEHIKMFIGETPNQENANSESLIRTSNS